jgi:hypothetical protein
MPSRSCRCTLERKLAWFRLDAHRVGEAEERADPGNDGVLVGDTCTDQERQRVMVDECEFSSHRLRPFGEAEWHEQPVSGPVIGSSVSSPMRHSKATGRS